MTDYIYDMSTVVLCTSQEKRFSAFWCGNSRSSASRQCMSRIATNCDFSSVTSHCTNNVQRAAPCCLQTPTRDLFSHAEKSRLISKLKQPVSCHWKPDQVFLYYSSLDYISNKYHKMLSAIKSLTWVMKVTQTSWSKVQDTRIASLLLNFYSSVDN